MELKIEITRTNTCPVQGILIKGPSVEHWLREIQGMGLSLASICVYPLASVTANVVWGCLVATSGTAGNIAIGRNEYCQLVHNLLYIPERSALHPQLSAAETATLLKGKKHIMHPDFGLAELEEPVSWEGLLQQPRELTPLLSEPAAAPYIPKEIRTFQVKPVKEEEALQALEEGHFPKQRPFSDEPLNPIEKARLFLYRKLFTSGKAGNAPGEKSSESSPLLSKIASIAKFFSGKNAGMTDKMKMDYEELERRNQKYFDRLMDMLQKDPEEALKYAIPLDPEGTQRGTGAGLFEMHKRWFDFSLYGQGHRPGGGTAVMPDSAFRQLQSQYLRIARQLIEQKDYRKAAFVYMKLLKDHTMAARTLEDGGFYQEAASCYLKYCSNNQKAAECFEKGNMTTRAIELYKEMNQYEKAGDLHNRIHQNKEAQVCYQKVADDYVQNHQFIKASVIFKDKMDNRLMSQELLMKGWRTNKDAANCLQHYFAGINGEKELTREMQEIYGRDVTPVNREIFLQVLHHQFKKHAVLAEPIRDMAYEIIVTQIPANPDIVSELRNFNTDDRELKKDTMRFKLRHRKQR